MWEIGEKGGGGGWHHHITTLERVDASPLVPQDALFMLRHAFSLPFPLSLSLALSLHPSRTLSDQLPRAPRCSSRDWWIKSVSVGRLGGKKRKTSEGMHSASFPNNTALPPLCVFDGLFGSSSKLSPSFLPWLIIPSTISLTGIRSQLSLKIRTLRTDTH